MRNVHFNGMEFVVPSNKGFIVTLSAYNTNHEIVRNVSYWVTGLPEAEEKVRLFTRFTVQTFGAVTVYAEVRRDDNFALEATYDTTRYSEERWKLALHDTHGNFIKWLGYPTAA